MPRYRPNPQDNPEKPGGEGWLVNDQQQLACQFKPDSPSAHGQWVSVRTYSWISPRLPVPQTRRRMVRHNSVEAWQTMLKTERLIRGAVVPATGISNSSNLQ